MFYCCAEIDFGLDSHVQDYLRVHASNRDQAVRRAKRHFEAQHPDQTVWVCNPLRAQTGAFSQWTEPPINEPEAA
jgi:hypothetical protein